MDEAQAGTLGDKMRDAYSDIASEPTGLAKTAKKRVSRRLRKSQAFARDTSATSGSSMVRQYPMASLLIAAGLGFVLSRL